MSFEVEEAVGLGEDEDEGESGMGLVWVSSVWQVSCGPQGRKTRVTKTALKKKNPTLPRAEQVAQTGLLTLNKLLFPLIRLCLVTVRGQAASH